MKGTVQQYQPHDTSVYSLDYPYEYISQYTCHTHVNVIFCFHEIPWDNRTSLELQVTYALLKLQPLRFMTLYVAAQPKNPQYPSVHMGECD